MEEGLLVDLACLVGVADEDQLDAVVAPAEKEMQQHEEALGQVLFPLAHRSGDIHQAEHDGPGVRLGLRLEVAVPDIERIEIGYGLLPPQQFLDRRVERRQFRKLLTVRLVQGLELEDPRPHFLDLPVSRPPQRQPATERVPHRALDVEIGRRPGDGLAGPPRLGRLGLMQRALDHIGQFEILEEDLQELVAG